MVNAVKRYAKANNRYMKDYNPDEASKYLMYLDANNLYEWAMIQKLPHDELRFKMNKENFKQYKRELYDLINNLNENDDEDKEENIK